MKKMTYAEGIREGMRKKMLEDPNVFIFGEDVGKFGGCFGVTMGMFDEFGDKRVRDTPISEGAIIGTAVGSAACGLRPIAELMFMDFVTVGMDQIVNQAAKLRYMTGGKITLPIVIRLPEGGGVSAAAQHSQSLEAWLTHVPGLKVVYPSNARDAYGLMISAIEDDNPVIYIENKTLYATKSEVEDELKIVPLGKASVKKEGTDVTIITYGRQVFNSLKASEDLAKDGINAEVIDLRSLYPFDIETIFKSVGKTHKVVIVSEEVKRGAFTGEIASIIAEECFYECDAPIKRVGSLNTPIPFASNLENYVLPNDRDIVIAVKSLF
ncbi:alpha-ketoacid dehydrogenase subunit beta [Acidilutibacter cellobiosedens]|jgi:pyruvate dehydrogenase E1 component beta subunit|uniref:Alpha-ketoacid dehydrogenase subunit beta n=1 Tax=Acidilutibacter cellobiosedens TaxID=2507161 RepID=A0A410Q8S3_9FIRM|nr:alpha-ketoacid dehydrogenase subunit beta [Acidilutibacter cellobiosedens]QAT60383.1 alpha-ketoacid dehydrogenase subunit beta [Acidilutibacter cellobiosedens]